MRFFFYDGIKKPSHFHSHQDWYPQDWPVSSLKRGWGVVASVSGPDAHTQVLLAIVWPSLSFFQHLPNSADCFGKLCILAGEAGRPRRWQSAPSLAWAKAQLAGPGLLPSNSRKTSFPPASGDLLSQCETRPWWLTPQRVVSQADVPRPHERLVEYYCGVYYAFFC